MDHIGVMANGVRDLAILFQTIAGPDGDPDFWFRSAFEPTPDCLADTSRGWGAPKVPISRLGGMFDDLATTDLLARYDAAVGKLESEWTPLERTALPTSFGEQPVAHHTVMSVEAASYHAERMKRHPDEYPPRVTWLITSGLAARGTAYSRALRSRDELRREFGSSFGRGRVLITPATPNFAPPLDTTGDPAFNTPWSFMGAPTASVPAGWSADGLPFAIQLISNFGNEPDLLAVATWVEESLGFARRPLPL
jgi:aspartyl-tRNA(Asn)/glutamyl-tRNA(Gln) amidotransferase subunit A